MQAAAEAARDAGEAASLAADAAPALPDNEMVDSEQVLVATTAAAAVAAAHPPADQTGSVRQAGSSRSEATSNDGAQAASPAAAEPESLPPPMADYDAGSAPDTQPEPEFPEQPAAPPGGGSAGAAQPSRGFALGPMPVDASQFMRLRYLVMMREEGSGRAVAVSLQGGDEAVLAFEVGRALRRFCSQMPCPCYPSVPRQQ
jgi:hypothetical protein